MRLPEGKGWSISSSGLAGSVALPTFKEHAFLGVEEGGSAAAPLSKCTAIPAGTPTAAVYDSPALGRDQQNIPSAVEDTRTSPWENQPHPGKGLGKEVLSSGFICFHKDVLIHHDKLYRSESQALIPYNFLEAHW